MSRCEKCKILSKTFRITKPKFEKQTNRKTPLFLGHGKVCSVQTGLHLVNQDKIMADDSR